MISKKKIKSFNLKKELEKWFDKWLHKKLTGRAIVELKTLYKIFVIREKKIISQFEDNLCDCDAFGLAEEGIHSTTCNYTRLMKEINSSIGYEVEDLIEDLKDGRS